MPEQPSRDEVTLQLNRILGSSAFTGGPRLGRFLAHVVQEELEGRGGALKGTAIAMDVFGRGTDFDPNHDPVVRVEAGKLRNALEHYYLTAGTGDDVGISVPKGTYRPVFQRRTPAEPKGEVVRHPALPRLVIFPFSGAGSDAAMLYREGLPEEIGLEMTRFGQITVLTGWTATEADARGMEADYALSGVVRESDGDLRVTIQLNRQPENAMIWSERFRVGPGQGSVFDLQESIAREVSIRIADAYGALSSDLGEQFSGRSDEDAGVFEALLAFHAHLRRVSVQGAREFRDLAEAALRDNPGSGLAHALVAISLVEAVAVGAVEMDSIIEQGSRHADLAVDLSPHCQEALFASAIYASVQGQPERFRVMIERALKANPNGTLMAAQTGAWIALAGDVARGVELVSDAMARNPLLPIWTELTLALGDLIEGRPEAAAERYRTTDCRGSVLDLLAAAAAFLQVGDVSSAETCIQRVRDMGVAPGAFVDSVPMHQDLRALLAPVLEIAAT